ncbi:MAG: ammonium transporter, partial [Pelagibacteraceae bacterium]
LEDVTAVADIFVNTNLAACGGVIAAAVLSRLIGGKTDVILMLNGAIAGLVAITAEPLAPSPFLAIVIGTIGGVIMYFATKLLFSLKIDDVVGAIPAHLCAGIFGTLVVPMSNSDTSFGSQFTGTISVAVFVFIVSYVIWKILDATMGIRISKEAERVGTDKVEIGVIAYGIRD